MKKLLTLVLSFALVAALTACTPETVYVDKEIVVEKEVPVEKIVDKVELVIYTNSIDESRMDTFNELVASANFDFDVTFVNSGGGDMRDRLIAEAYNPVADIVLGGSFLEMGALVDAGILAPYSPDWASEIDQSFIGPDNLYTGYAVDTVHFIYRTDLVGGAGQPIVPTSWEDIVYDSSWTGQYWAFKPTGTTGQVIIASILNDYLSTSGDLGVSDAGWDVIANYYSNARTPFPGGFMQEFRDGTIVGGTIWGGGAMMYINEDLPVEVMIPEAGTPHFASNIAIVDTDNLETMALAQQFVDWWGTDAVQLKWCEVAGKPSTKESVNAMLDETTAAFSEKISDVQDIDWSFVYDHNNSWTEEQALNYYVD